MARRPAAGSSAKALLRVRDLHVYYGSSHALQGVSFTLEQGIHAIVGRNGMGKTTLCNTVLGLLPARRGSIRFAGHELLGLAPHQVAALGIGYTPQGRRLWPSLTVDEHLRLGAVRGASWSVERVYDTFPRLAERRHNGGAQLSGGEQQMLAISRALLKDPRLLVLDEPTEGLAPVIVTQVEEMLATLTAEAEVGILLVEQNIGVATAIASDVAIMVNGAITAVIPAAQLATDRQLQQRLLGVGRLVESDNDFEQTNINVAVQPSTDSQEEAKAEEEAAVLVDDVVQQQPDWQYIPPTRWSAAAWKARTDNSPALESIKSIPRPAPTNALISQRITTPSVTPKPLYQEPKRNSSVGLADTVLVVGTFDTKRAELRFIYERLREHKLKVTTVDVSTSETISSADIPPHQIAAYHPGGANTVFSNDRGAAVAAMAEALQRWLKQHTGVAGIISAAGSGGTALVTPAMRQLPVGVPKVMISTVASGNVGQYVGPADIMMMYSVTDIQGINRISRQILANGADALAGMVRLAADRPRASGEDKPAIGLTMFGVTTAAVQQITAELDDYYDCLVFHATGVGGRAMEKLADNGLISAAIDLTTTEVCDLTMGGIFAADEDRFSAFIRTGLPYVGSVGALDMVNFAARDTVPERYQQRLFVEHNPQVTLMRTTTEENTRMGQWIVERLNQMPGPVRFLLPEKGVSALDAPGQAFHDPEADSALFAAISQQFRETSNHRLLRLPYHINDPQFAVAAVAALNDIVGQPRRTSNAAI